MKLAMYEIVELCTHLKHVILGNLIYEAGILCEQH